MWWGGGGNEEGEGGIAASEGDDSPPLEILAEDEELEYSTDDLSPRSTSSSLPVKMSKSRPLSRG